MSIFLRIQLESNRLPKHVFLDTSIFVRVDEKNFSEMVRAVDLKLLHEFHKYMRFFLDVNFDFKATLKCNFSAKNYSHFVKNLNMTAPSNIIVIILFLILRFHILQFKQKNLAQHQTSFFRGLQGDRLKSRENTKFSKFSADY